MKEKLDKWLDRVSQMKVFQPGSLSPPAVAVVVGGGVVLIALIAWASLRKTTPPPAPLAEGAPWICKNGHEFSPTAKQLLDHKQHPDEPVACPVCGAAADPAVKCPKCGKMVVPGPAPDHLCPNCKFPIVHY